MVNVTKNNIQSNTPTILVVFGVGGDLATRKIIPSLWRLFSQGLLGDHFSVIGFSRRDASDDNFKLSIASAVRSKSSQEIDDGELSRFVGLFSYHAGKFEDTAAFRALAGSIEAREKTWGVCANKLFYLAAPPVTYKPIFENLAAVKLNLPCGGKLGWTPLEAEKKREVKHRQDLEHKQHSPLTGWSRLLIEKPFGTDLESARSLQSLLAAYFKEEQLYRIDHYLFKEIVQGMENFRFSNNLFENTWDNTTIERIDVRLHESIGVEGRGGFYDAVGALRDVGQNHLLTMLATLLMEYPARGNTEMLRENRARIINALNPWTEALIQKNTFRAQYKGYLGINGVREHSITETYFALKTELTDPRWKGVPIFMEAGKRLHEARKEIIVTLKHPRECLMCEVGPHRPNQIVFRLEPNDEIVIHFWAKKPGFDRSLEERTFSFFLYEKDIKIQYVAEYAKVLLAAIRGEQASFVSPNEIEAAWKFTDSIVDGWRRNLTPLAEYKPDTTPRQSFKEDAYAGEVGIIGLGKMGGNLARRLAAKKWKVVGFNRTPEATRELEKEGVVGAYSIKDFVDKLHTPRIVWLMVPASAEASAGKPAGSPVDEIIFGKDGLINYLDKGDIIVDGGNSFYKDSIRREKKLKAKGIHFLDVGVSGGPASIQQGKFAIMVGGEKEIYEKSRPIFDAMSDTSSGYMGRSGAGHFAKMVHNGIEYGMMQSLAEGFTILKKSLFKFRLKDVANVYNQNSIITSRLTGWLEEGFKEYGEDLKKASGIVAHTGEGEWTVKTAKELGVLAPVIKGSYLFRVRSIKNPSFTGKILSMLRAVFGGHEV